MTISMTQLIEKLAARCPFAVAFEVKPDFTGLNHETTTVARWEIPTFKELLQREAWFFQEIQKANTDRGREITSKISLLNAKAKEHFGLPSFKVASQLLFSSEETDTFNRTVTLDNGETEERTETFDDFRQTSEYEDFQVLCLDQLQDIMDLTTLANNNQLIDWVTVTYFMMSRVDGEWSASNTASLRNSEIQEILNFITLEANSGVVPTQESLPEANNEGSTETEGKG